MKKRIATKIINAVIAYKLLMRWDMPYNGNQIYRAAKKLFLPLYRSRFKGWHKESADDGKRNFINRINGL